MAAGSNQVIKISGGSGIAGAIGPTGSKGDSAYEVAVAGGYAGNVNAWITSLQGATGSVGLQGIQGIQGQAGVGINVLPPVVTNADRDALTALNSGDSVLVTDTGEFWIWDSTTNGGIGSWHNGGHLTGSQGVQGIQGIQGIKGDTGLRGIQGEGIHLKGHDTTIAINGVTGSPGDIWISTTPGPEYGHGFISNGTPGATQWTDIGPIQGNKGNDGTNSIIVGSGTRVAIETIFGTGHNPVGSIMIIDDPADPNDGEGLLYDGLDLDPITGLPTGTMRIRLVGQIRGYQGHTGSTGSQGPAGVGINVLPPVADHAAVLATLNPQPGNSILQIDTGDFWTFGADGNWHNAGHLVGIQGNVGPQGTKGDIGPIGVTGGIGLEGPSAHDIAINNGYTGNEVTWLASLRGTTGTNGTDGTDGKDGIGIHIMGSIDNATIMGTVGNAGDLWIDTLTGDGYVSDGLGSGAAHWTNIGVIQGPVGPTGTQGIQGPAGTGINVLPPVADEPARNALSVGWGQAEIGKSVLQSDTGVFWSWNGSSWINAGHLVGAQGVAGSQGIQGQTGPQGTPGVDGVDASVVPIDSLISASSTDSLAARQGKILDDKITTNATKLSGIAIGAEVNVKSNWLITNINNDAFIENKPSIVNNLVTGGSTSLLSAEQGKILQSNKADKAITITGVGSIIGGGSLSANRTITHSTSAGNKHIPAGGSTNQYLKYSSSGTAVWATAGDVNVQSDWNVNSGDAAILHKPDVVTSTTSGSGKRIPEIVEMTRAAYNALGSHRPRKLYVIVN